MLSALLECQFGSVGLSMSYHPETTTNYFP